MTDHYRGNAASAAASKGCIIVLPAKNELFIDIDDGASLALFYDNVWKLGDLVSGFRRAPSPSGKIGREHITVTLSRDVRDAFERILLQTLLGSDRVHEALSWWSASHGIDNPTVFFERPPVACEIA